MVAGKLFNDRFHALLSVDHSPDLDTELIQLQLFGEGVTPFGIENGFDPEEKRAVHGLVHQDQVPVFKGFLMDIPVFLRNEKQGLVLLQVLMSGLRCQRSPV